MDLKALLHKFRLSAGLTLMFISQACNSRQHVLVLETLKGQPAGIEIKVLCGLVVNMFDITRFHHCVGLTPTSGFPGGCPSLKLAKD